MTLNIEQERREFEAAFKELRQNSKMYLGWVEGRHCFRDPAVQGEFEMWLAAKRSTIGAEPVTQIEIYHLLHDMRLAPRNQLQEAAKKIAALYAAPPSTDAKDALQLVYDVIKLWNIAGNVSSDDYHEEMCRIEDAMRTIAAKEPTP